MTLSNPADCEPISMLEARLTPTFTQAALAEEIGISPQYLSEILRFKKPPSDLVLDFLGLEKIVTYRPKPDGHEKPAKKTRARARRR